MSAHGNRPREEVKGMSSKKKVSKSGAVWHKSAVENTLDHMPKYNGFACGHGAHGDTKYNRAKAKRAWQNELEPRGARNRGLLPFLRETRREMTAAAYQLVCLSARRRTNNNVPCGRDLPQSLRNGTYQHHLPTANAVTSFQDR